jgi:hypothetical protein
MAERALKCPQCNAPLAASRFARSAVCPFCGSTVLFGEQTVPASRFRAAFQSWNSPESHGFTDWVSLGDSHWARGPLVARGEVSDVHAAARARWPTERALLKSLRDPRDAPGFDHEWEVLARLQESDSATSFAGRIPQPIARGRIIAGASAGTQAMVFRWASGFTQTFEDARRAFPHGIEPRASIWIWRRILEALWFLHAAGFVHGAVLPPHLLVEDGEHGVRLVGFRAADRAGSKLRDVSPGYEPVYPRDLLADRKLTPAADLAMSARCVAALLGGDLASGEVPALVPAPLAREIDRVAGLRAAGDGDAWRLRERLGGLAREVFGAPTFCPLRLPGRA